MSSTAITRWPLPMEAVQTATTWTESSHVQKQIVAGERFGIALTFTTGKAIESIALAVGAHTAADTLTLEIQGLNTTHDAINATGYPDGTAITNGTASVSGKGGVAEWVVWEFTTGSEPTPLGKHWIVIEGTSAGAFDVQFRYVGDWSSYANTPTESEGLERVYDGADWNNSVTLGRTPCRIKYTDGTYDTYAARTLPPISTLTETVGYVSTYATGTKCEGAKITAPYDMDLRLIRLSFRWYDAYGDVEVVVTDSSNVELFRTQPNWYYSGQGGAYSHELVIPTPITLAKDDVFYIYITNPAKDINSYMLNCVSGATAPVYGCLGFTSSQIVYVHADDPIAEGGAAAWTEVANQFPLILLGTEQDMSTYGGGGGTPGMTAHVSM